MLHARSDYNRIQDPDGLIGDDEPVFLVRAKDQAFVDTLKEWIRIHDDAGGDPLMSTAVEKHIQTAIEWQRKNGTKIADAPTDAFS